jgi:GntR family transcriptional repressor for pyruvate dehydrogenase complex
MEIRPVSPNRVYQEIIAQLVEFICAGEIKPGDSLPSERKLSEQFKASRSSVREAIRVMEVMGLLRVQPGGGVFVTELNVQPFIKMLAPLLLRYENYEKELLDLRRILEVRSAQMAAEQITPERAAYISEPIRMMDPGSAGNDPDVGLKSDILFHSRIVESSGSLALRHASGIVSALMEVLVQGGRKRVLENRETAAELYAEHVAIRDAICRGDSLRAGELIDRHIQMVISLTVRGPAD